MKSIVIKKKLALLSFVFFFSTYCQAQLVSYEPVRVESSSSVRTHRYYNPYSDPYQTNNLSRSAQSNERTIIGYVFNTSTNNFKRAKIKVEIVNGILKVTSIYNGKIQKWHSFNASAQKVGQVLGVDSEFICDNFEWKISNTYVGTIYYNY
jgi:hypothetical protein